MSKQLLICPEILQIEPVSGVVIDKIYGARFRNLTELHLPDRVIIPVTQLAHGVFSTTCGKCIRTIAFLSSNFIHSSFKLNHLPEGSQGQELSFLL